MHLAQHVDSNSDFARLCSPAMDASSLGARVLDALIPGHYPDLNALHRASGIAYSTLQKWKHGGNEPRWEQVQKLAELVGVSPFALILGASKPGNAMTLRHHPGWATALADATARPGLPAAAYELAGDTAAAQWPEQIDAFFVRRLAEFWHLTATDRKLIDAETAAVRAEMRAEDEKARAGARPKTGVSKKARS